MPALTLKNIPKELRSRLKESAEEHRRSLNREILVRLESNFAAPTVDPGTLARRLKAFAARPSRVERCRVTRHKCEGRA
jgi:plasmid stability protein